MLKFRFNNDLWPLRVNLFNLGHFFGSALLALLWGFWIAWGLGVLWEVGDGFKKKDTGHERRWRRWLLRSDGFSLQDVLVWDLGGCVVGLVIYQLIYL